jgi:iron complex outermembrane recepter protein
MIEGVRLRALSARQFLKLRTAAALVVVSAAAAGPAFAQRAGDNAVTAAEDAFGSSIGNESIGLYSPTQVRGFSPVSAGNVRIEGVYFDRQGAISQRLVSGSTVRVGLSAQGYLFPAPTGIVDYRLRDVGAQPIVSVVAGSFAYGAPGLEVDAQIPLHGERLGVAAGASWNDERYYDGSDAPYFRASLIPRWRPNDVIEIIPFWSATVASDEEVAPAILAAGAFEPPKAPRQVYFGQDWATKANRSVNAGLIAKVRISQQWSLVAGAFRSTFGNDGNFAELFVDTQPDGTTTERVIADPGQRYASTSGELRLSRTLAEGPRLHVLHASVRARRLDSRYGGAAAPIDLGRRPLGVAVPVPKPDSFAFGERTRDAVRQTTLGLAYEGRWRDVGELSFGVQRADYRKTVQTPGALASAGVGDKPWLFSAAVAAYLSHKLALYAGHTRGLEESGLAPNSAANRNEALPAIRTRQTDAGLRWAATSRVKLVAGVFDVRKPYFNSDEANVYAILGDVRHRGVELSIAGSPLDSLTVVAGAVLMRPRVTGSAVEQGRVGRLPLGQAGRTLRANMEYRPPALPGVSIDAAVSHVGERAASRDNLVSVDGYTTIDLGARYRFSVGGSPATFRVQASNLTNTYVWSILGSNSYGLTDKRRVAAFVTVDF